MLLAAVDPLQYESEQAWFRLLTDVAPGRPGAAERVDAWLVRYGAAGWVARVAAARALADAHRYGTEREVLRAWQTAKQPIEDLRVPRVHAERSGGDGGGIDLEVRPYTQLAFAPSVAVLPVDAGLGATAFLGVAYEPVDAEGVIGVGVTATTGEPVRFELATGVGGDGVLLWVGAGAGRGAVLHQYGQVELTTDGDQPWPVLGLRLQAEEDPLGSEPAVVRGMVLAGFKLGETPD